jgi:hypothetical protein
MTLPREEWEIAQALAAQSRLWTEQRRLRESDLTPVEKARFRPQREALRHAQQSVVKRIEALEHYAERTAAADATYLTQRRRLQSPPDNRRQIQELEARDEEYQELLAGTVSHDLAASRIAELGEDAGEVETVLRQASQAGRRIEGPRAQDV